MSEDLLINLIIGTDVFVVLLTITLVVYLLSKAQRRRYQNLSESEVQIIEAEQKASSIIHHAVKQAQRMIVRAELEGITLLSKLKIQVTKLEEEQQKQMQAIMTDMKSRMDARSLEAEKSYQSYLQSLEGKLQTDLESKQDTMKVKIDQMFNQTQGMLNTFVVELSKQTEVQIDKEIGRARGIIDDYRVKRLEVVDENIVAILERTLNITLGKKLTLADQTQLVYEALEEAKKENVFV